MDAVGAGGERDIDAIVDDKGTDSAPAPALSPCLLHHRRVSLSLSRN